MKYSLPEILVIVGLSLLIGFIFYKLEQVDSECFPRGGVVIQQAANYVCVKSAGLERIK